MIAQEPEHSVVIAMLKIKNGGIIKQYFYDFYYRHACNDSLKYLFLLMVIFWQLFKTWNVKSSTLKGAI